MDTLFEIPSKYPEGFYYYDNFITSDEEAKLYEEIKKVELRTFTFQGFEAKRKTASFGFDYSFDKRNITEGKAIPEEFKPLIEKVAVMLKIPTVDFGELLLTEYPVGSVINWHRDAPPFDVIAGISLMADCTFKLRPHDRQKQSRSSIISFPVKRRSLYVISGASRTEWQHSISPVKNERFSITLRTLRS